MTRLNWLTVDGANGPKRILVFTSLIFRKIGWRLGLLSASICLGLNACRSPGPVNSTSEANRPSTRDNCYSLLHELLDEEKDVSLLRFIKHENPELKALIKKIAAAAGAGSKRLEQFAKEDSSLHLNETSLPPGEMATRKAIAATKKKELLSKSGEAFELSLLLTQTEALRYGAHLAKVAHAVEPQPERANVLADLSAEMERLYGEVFEMISRERQK